LLLLLLLRHGLPDVLQPHGVVGGREAGRFHGRRGAHGDDAAARGVRHRGVVAVLGQAQGVHQGVVAPARRDARLRVAGPRGARVQRVHGADGAAGHQDLLRYLGVPLHAPPGPPLRHPHLPHRLRDVPPRPPRGALVRHGRRRHRLLPRQPPVRAQQVRPPPALLHRLPLREPPAEHLLLLRHGVRRRRLRHQPPAGRGARADAGRLPPPVPGALRQRRPDPGVHGGARRAAHQAPGVPPVRRVRRPAGPPRVAPGGADRDAAPPRRRQAPVPERQVPPRGGAAAVRWAREAGHGGADAAVHLLRRRQPVDGVRGVGVRGAGGEGRNVAAGDGDAGAHVPQLVPARRLHGVRVQHAAPGAQPVPEARGVLPVVGAGRGRARRRRRGDDGDAVRAVAPPERDAAGVPVGHRRPGRASRSRRRAQEAGPRALGQ
ncbi:hypothetical protein BAE44_0024815, partial [Dichanthelium oligosanthes]